MKKGIKLALAVLLASSASAQVYFQGTLEEALSKAKAEKKLILLDFFNPG